MLGAIVILDPNKCEDAKSFLRRCGPNPTFTVVGVKHGGGRVCVACNEKDHVGHKATALKDHIYRKLPEDQVKVLRRRECLYFVDTSSVVVFENEE